MSDYLSPEIEKVIPKLSEMCDTLIRQDLIRALTAKTQEWCEGDPELAEAILDGEKTLEGCIKYVLEQAAAVIAKNIAAMPKAELDALPTETINGQKATMAGGMISDERTYEFARDYYYKIEVKNENAGKTPKAESGKTKKVSEKKRAGTPKEANGKPETGAENPSVATETKTENTGPEQMMLLGAA